MAVVSRESLANCPDGGLRSIRNANLSKDVLDVLFDCFVADFQVLCDLFVRQPVHHLHNHFALASCELNIRSRIRHPARRPRPPKVFARPQRFASHDTMNALQEFAPAGRLQQQSVRSDRNRLRDYFRASSRGVEQDIWFYVGRLELLKQSESCSARRFQAQGQQLDGRMIHQQTRGIPNRGFTNDLDVRPTYEFAQSSPH